MIGLEIIAGGFIVFLIFVAGVLAGEWVDEAAHHHSTSANKWDEE